MGRALVLGLALSAALGCAVAQAGGPQILVVVGSFTDRAQAEARRASIAHPSMDIMEAVVDGRRRYRVVIRPAGREDALRQLSVVRASGIRDAWLLSLDGPEDHSAG